MTEHLRASPPERYEAISQHLLEQAQEELDKGDILQASEKLWGATAHAIKAHSQLRGWNHHGHNHIRDAATYIALERDRQDLDLLFVAMEAMHTNYYEHQLKADEVERRIGNANFYTREMAALRFAEPPGNQAHLSPTERREQENRLRRLTRKTQFSHGPEFSTDELADLPPARPMPS